MTTNDLARHFLLAEFSFSAVDLRDVSDPLGVFFCCNALNNLFFELLTFLSLVAFSSSNSEASKTICFLVSCLIQLLKHFRSIFRRVRPGVLFRCVLFSSVLTLFLQKIKLPTSIRIDNG